MPDDLEPVPNAPGFYRPRRDALAPVTAVSLGLPPRIGGMATSGEIDARVHSVPTVTRRREEMAYTGPDPLLMRACETICASIGLSIHAAGALPSGRSAEEHLGTAIAAGVRNGVTAASCDLAGEIEALRSTVAAAREDIATLIGSAQDRAVRVALEAVEQRLVEVGG